MGKDEKLPEKGKTGGGAASGRGTAEDTRRAGGLGAFLLGFSLLWAFAWVFETSESVQDTNIAIVGGRPLAGKDEKHPEKGKTGGGAGSGRGAAEDTRRAGGLGAFLLLPL